MRLLLELGGSPGEAEVPALELRLLDEVAELGVADGPDRHPELLDAVQADASRRNRSKGQPQRFFFSRIRIS